ncbi:major facilitator superfamily domain-containing protein [Tuber borchii]|uniref:Major facilitator superfamily domain-containing protein n=1 Tax=Tuber borchii TaxID=42251 RepID=A0A2T6ZNQ2_TUBBO|nr:major facilitator superfamily domain-containing protein [Tuber borchii]
MGVGIYELKPARQVPGTVTLYEDQGTEEALSRTSHLKHGTGKDSKLLLVPQPSNSPNDPLNWPWWKKDLTLFVLCLTAAVAAALGPAIAPINKMLVDEFKTTYKVTAKFAGWQFWPAGIAGLFGSAVGRVWGKRPVYIVSTLLLFIGAIWNALAQNTDSFLGARILQGFGLGAFETIVPSTVGDMYFVHQRGKRIAFYNLTFLGSTYFMPVLGGYISTRHGWRSQFQIISAFLGLVLIIVILLVPEHAYNRPAIFNTDLYSDGDLGELDDQLRKAMGAKTEGGMEVDEKSATSNGAEQEGIATPEREIGSGSCLKSGGITATVEMPIVSSGEVTVADSSEERKTWVQELRVYNGRFSDESFFKLIFAPFALFLYPATLWAFSFQGTFITWGIAVSVVLAQMFAGPPTNFGPEKLGYMYTAPFIGALSAYFFGASVSDWSAKWMARKNNNIYEPEFRILLVIPVAFFGLPGLYAYGHVADMHLHWIFPSILYGLLTFAVVVSCTATFSYILDAHRDIAVEMMVSMLLLKNFFAFGCTYFLVDWVDNDGPARVFDILGAIQTAVCVLSIPMYIFGKAQRDFMARHNLLKKWGLYPKSAETALPVA